MTAVDEMQLVVELVTQNATKAAEAFTEGLVSGFKDALKESQKTEAGVAKVGGAAKRAGKEAESGFSSFQAKIVSLNQGIDLLSRGFTIATSSISRAVSFIQRGAGFDDLIGSLDNLAQKAGTTGDLLLSSLNASLEGTVAKSDLARLAVENLFAGLKPDQIKVAADAARTFSDVLGGSAQQNFDRFTDALVRGNTGLLQRIGITVDAAQAERDYLVSLGVATKDIETYRKALDETQRVEAVRIASVEALNQKLREFSKPALDAGDLLDQIAAGAKNFGDQVASGVAGNETLNKQLSELARILQTTNFDPYISKLAFLGSVFVEVGNVVGESVFDITKFTIEAGRSLGQMTGIVDQAAAATTEHNAALDSLFEGVSNSTPPFVQLNKEIEQQAKTTPKASSELDKLKSRLSSLNGGTGSASKALKDAGDDFERFSDSLSNTLNIDTFPQLTKQIEDLFNSGKSNSELQKAFEQVGKSAQALKIPLDEVSKRVSSIGSEIKKQAEEAAKLASEGGFGPGNNEGIKTAADEQRKAAEETEQAIIDGFQKGAEIVQTVVSLFSDIQSGQFFAKGNRASSGQQVGSLAGSFFGQDAAAAGGAIGSVLGQASELFSSGGDEGTKARKDADRFFADLFDANRLSIIINGELQRVADLTFKGDTLFGGSSDFASGTFDDFLSSLPAATQEAFNAVGSAFEGLLGVSDEVSGQIAAVLANNIGGSLNNLQLLVQATGQSFESLGDAIFESFFSGTLSIQEAAIALQQLQDIFTIGIPGAVGDVAGAFSNFQAALGDNRGSRALIDSLRDIAAEAQKLGIGTMPALANAMVNTFGLSAQQVAAFFEAAKAAGIGSLNDLLAASNSTLVNIAANVQNITAGQAPSFGAGAANPSPFQTPPTNFTAGAFPKASSSGGGGGSAAKKVSEEERKRKEELKRLRDETFRVLQTSSAYENVLKRLTDETITQKNAGGQIKKLYSDVEKIVKKLTKAEEEYRKELEKGEKGNAKKLSELAKIIQESEKAIKDFNSETKKIDLSPITRAIRDQNVLGLVNKELGVSFENLADSITESFKRGYISIEEANKQLHQSKELLGSGIPNAIGAVDLAFNNVLRGGRNGGLFSIDAVRDVFAEGKELFDKNIKAFRKDTENELVKAFDSARDKLEETRKSGASESAIVALSRDFDLARKKLDDFRGTTQSFTLDDLRAQLEKTYSADQVSIFFTALGQNGINTFDDIKNASDTAIVQILGSLDTLGLKFEGTSQDVLDLNKGFQDVAASAAGGIDPLQKTSELTKAWLDTANLIPITLTTIGQNTDVLNVSFGIVHTSIGDINTSISQTWQGLSAVKDTAGGLELALNSGKQSLDAFAPSIDSIKSNFDSLQEQISAIFDDDYQIGITFKFNPDPTDTTTKNILDILNTDPSTTLSGDGISNTGNQAKKKRVRRRYKYLNNIGKKAEAEKLKRDNPEFFDS